MSHSAAIASQWTSLAPHIEDHIVELNSTLQKSTYITGNEINEIDSIIFKVITPLAKSWIPNSIAQYRHILRWIDLLQNTVEGLDAGFKIDLNVELPREIKEKKEKKPVADAKADTKATPATPAATEAAPTQKGPRGKPSPEEIAKAKAAKEAKKAAKKAAGGNNTGNTPPTVIVPVPSMIDIRVGFIEKAIKHPDADSLYVSTIQMGDEEGPRTVCSGLVKHFELEEMQKRKVIVIANLKPVNMRGIKSCAMVLCAASPEGKIEFVNPPTDSKAGDKLFFEGFDGTPEKVLNPKKKIWETVQPGFTTVEDFSVVYKQEGKPDAYLVDKAGNHCKCTSIVNAEVR